MTDLEERRRVDALATYNSERSRGLVHTAGYQAHMADEQQWFNEEYTPAMWTRMGYERADDSGPFPVYRKVKRPFWKRLLAVKP